METSKKTVEQILSAIEALDLDPIKFKLMNPEEGQGWTRQQADDQEREYRRFLTLSVKYPDEIIVPSKAVDKFWHTHILDTLKYAEDCQNVFGYFFHHFPYFGMRGEQDASNLAAAGVNTQRLYEKEFGQGGQVGISMCARMETSMCARVEASMCAQPQSIVSDTLIDINQVQNVVDFHTRPALAEA